MRRTALLGLVAAALAGCPPSTPTPPPPPATTSPPPVTADRPVAQATEPAPLGPDTGPAPNPAPEETETPNPWDPKEPINPGPPAAPPAPEPEKELERVPTKDGAIERFPGIRIYRDEKRLEVDGAICLKRGPALELMGCTRRGKTHESLLLFDCEPEQLHLALLLLGLEPTPQVDEFGQAIALERGERVVVEATWAEKDQPPGDPSAPRAEGGRIRRRVEDLVFDRRKQTSMPRVGWVFTGSRHIDVPAPPDWKQSKKVYAAAYAGNVAATYHDPDAILDTPLLEGGDDTIYEAWSDRLPERGTDIVLHLRPWREGDGPPLPRPAAIAPVTTPTGTDPAPGPDQPR